MAKKKKYEQLEVIPTPDAKPRKRKSPPNQQRAPVIILGIVATLLFGAGLIIVLLVVPSDSSPLPNISPSSLITTVPPTPLQTGEYIEALAPSGDQLIVAGSSTLRLYEGNQLVRLFDGYNFNNSMHSNRVDVAFRPGSNQLASLTTRRANDKPVAELTIWDQTSGDIIQRQIVHEGGFSNTYWGAAVAYSPDGNWLATGAGDATIALWNAETGDLLTRLPADFVTGTRALAFSADGKRLAATIYTGSDYSAVHRGAGLQVWNLNSLVNPERIFSQSLHYDGLHWTAFSLDGRYFATTTDRNPENYEIVVWDLATLTPVGNINLPRDVLGSSIISLAFSPDNTQLAFVHRRLLQASTGPGIPVIEDIAPRVFNWQTGEELATGPVLGMKGAYELYFSSDGTALHYIDANDNNLRRWHIGTQVVELMNF